MYDIHIRRFCMDTPIILTTTLGDALLFGAGFTVALLLLSIARNLVSGFAPPIWPMSQPYPVSEQRNGGLGCFSWLLLLGGLAALYYFLGL
jgi:hypothetical protein